ncbi:MAG: hypothetical protein ACK41G_02520 [Candidatus Thermochlorobacter sp.]
MDEDRDQNTQFETARDPLTAHIVKPIIGNILLGYENLQEDATRIINNNLNFLINVVPKISETYVKNYANANGFASFPIGKSRFPISKIANIIDKMKGKWIVAIDESMLDEEMFTGNVSYRHSSAFGMRIDETGGEPKEKTLAVSSVVKIQEEEHFADKMKFVSYLMNLYIAYYTAQFLISIGEKVHSIIIHGPLIRQLGPFMELYFKYDLLKQVFSLGRNVEFGKDISDEIKSLGRGQLLQKLLDSNEYKECLEQIKGYTRRKPSKDEHPGICLYLCLMKELYDYSKTHNFYVIGCVETVRSSEYTDVYFRYQVESYYQANPDEKTAFNKILEDFKVKSSDDIKNDFLLLREKAGWDDEKLIFFGMKYDTTQQYIHYTNPVPIRRYFSSQANEEVFDLKESFAKRISSTSDNAQNGALNNMLKHTLKFPDYKVLMSYVRTSELKAPIRVEFFDTESGEKQQNIMPFVYAVSQPYSSFGLPIFLYFADKIARVPKSIISTVTAELLMKKAVEYVTKSPNGEMNFVHIVNALLNKFRRDFTER